MRTNVPVGRAVRLLTGAVGRLTVETSKKAAGAVMASSPICVVDPLHACRSCSARGPEECPYRYLLADAATLEGWASVPAEGTADGTSDRLEEPGPGV